MSQTLLNKAFDGLALAQLIELAAQLRQENMHESAVVVEGLADEFRRRFVALAPYAVEGQRLVKGRERGGAPRLLSFGGDGLLDQLDQVSRLASRAPDLDRVADLLIKLSNKKRLVAIEWVEYARDRVMQFQAAIVKLCDLWSSLVPPIDQVYSDHAAIVHAYRVLNHLGGE